MRENIYKYIELISQIHKAGPVVEWGSRKVSVEQSATNDLRPLFKRLKYIGCDVTKGKGVDKVDNLVTSKLPSDFASTILCCETLEHVFDIHKAAKQLIRVINKKNGLIVVSVPSGDFPIHWPPDYWRMTPEAMDKLFEKVPYRTVLFQGRLEQPHTVLGVFTFNKNIHNNVKTHLFENMASIPSYNLKGENIYLWINAQTYCLQRKNAAKAETLINNS